MIITICNTLNDKIVRMTETEFDNLSPEGLRLLGPEWIDEPDVEMKMSRTDDVQQITFDGVTRDVQLFHREGDVLVCLLWRRSDKKIRNENSDLHAMYQDLADELESSENNESSEDK